MDYTNFTQNRPIYLVANEVDVAFGNNNGKIDGNERSIFTNIIKARFGYDFDFNGDISAQGEELNNIYNSNQTLNLEGKTFFASINRLDGNIGRESHYVQIGDGSIDIIRDSAGKTAGREFATDAIGLTNDEESRRMSRMVDRLSLDYGEELNERIVTNFLNGYYDEKSFLDSGLFEQLASEGNSSKITNSQAANLLNSIMRAVPEEKRAGKDWQTLVRAYNKYSQKDPAGYFKNEQWGISRLWHTTNYIDNLDDAIERLFNL